MNVFKVGEETHILDGYNEDCTVFEVDEAGLNMKRDLIFFITTARRPKKKCRLLSPAFPVKFAWQE